MIMGYTASNAVTGQNNRSKRAEIPITIIGNASTPASIACTVDAPWTGAADIGWANQAGASSTPVWANGGAATSGLDSSAAPANGDLNCDQAQVKIAILCLDGANDLQGANVPLPGNAQNPTYGTPVAKGSASFLRKAEFVASEGAVTSIAAGQVASALRANLGSAGVTTNGNVYAVLTFAPFMVTSAVPAAIAPLYKAAGTIKGIVTLVWD
jgi:hypothetical protein